MTISAIIPAYNSAEFIRQAILSIQNQCHSVDEIIIVDDGSTDNTEQIVKSLSGNIRYHKQPNQGPSAARNQGIKLAEGDWIAFLDADDQWTEDKIAKQLAVLECHPSLHLIAGDMAEISIDGKLLVESMLAKHHLLRRFRELANRPLPNAVRALLEKNFIPTGTVLVKRASLLEAGLFNERIRFGEDLEIWTKIAARHPITCMADVLMLRRQHGQNATQMTEPLLRDLVEVARSLADSIPDAISEQGMEPKRLIAQRLNDLGYWYFSQGEYISARKVFSTSMSDIVTSRAALYFVSCFLPVSVIRFLKQVKRTSQ